MTSSKSEDVEKIQLSERVEQGIQSNRHPKGGSKNQLCQNRLNHLLKIIITHVGRPHPRCTKSESVCGVPGGDRERKREGGRERRREGMGICSIPFLSNSFSLA